MLFPANQPKHPYPTVKMNVWVYIPVLVNIYVITYRIDEVCYRITKAENGIQKMVYRNYVTTHLLVLHPV